MFRFTMFLALAGCANTAPGPSVVEITPTLPTTVDDLSARVVSDAPDADDDDVSYTFSWFVDGEQRPDLRGSSVPSSETGRDQVWRVIVIADDGQDEGPPSEASVTIQDTPPTVTLSLSPQSPTTTDDLVAQAEVEDIDGDTTTLQWSWYLDGIATTYAEDTLPADATSRGQRWTVEVVADDDGQTSEPASASIDIGNSPPQVTAVALSPDPPSTLDTLTAAATAEDADDDAVSLSYAWSVGGKTVQEGDLATLSGELFDKHDEVVVTVTPNDATDDGEAFVSGVITVANTPPAITGASLDPAEIFEATTVSCVAAGWTDDDGDTEGYTWSWTVDGADAGVTTQTITGTAFNRGQQLSCTVTPTDGEDAGAPLTTDPTTVSNTVPVVSLATLSSASPRTNDTLAVSVSSDDDDSDPISLAYQWVVNGAEVGWSDTLDGAAFSKGQSVYVLVTPSDDADKGATVASDTAVVINTAPVLSSVPISPSEPGTADRLSALVSKSDDDGDTVTLAYDWAVDGTSVATSSTLSGLTWFDKGQEVWVTVTPDDGEDAGTALTSDAVTVVNTPPTTPVISIDPASPKDEDDLVCGLATASTDADGDTITYDFGWTVDGASYSGGTTTTLAGDTVPASDTNEGEEWECTVVSDDGDDLSEKATDAVSVNDTSCDPASGDDLQTCIDEAADGATLTVGPGAFSANVEVTGKTITLVGDSTGTLTSWSCADDTAKAIKVSSGADVTLQGFIFEYCDNTTSDSQRSGVVLLNGGVGLTVDSCIFRYNKSHRGAAVTTWHGSWTGSSGQVTLTNNIMHDNQSDDGGVVYINGATNITIHDNLVYDNDAVDYCGAFWLRDQTRSMMTFTKNTVYNNSAGRNPALEDYSGDGPTVNSSIVYANTPSNMASSWASSYSLVGTNPQFTNASAGDFSLKSGSPALNTGDPSLPNDADGTRTDMGCDLTALPRE